MQELLLQRAANGATDVFATYETAPTRRRHTAMLFDAEMGLCNASHGCPVVRRHARLTVTEQETEMPETYKGFRFEASVVAVASGEFRGTALIFNGKHIVWRELNATTFPTEAEARTEAEITAPNVIDRLIERGELSAKKNSNAVENLSADAGLALLRLHQGTAVDQPLVVEKAIQTELQERGLICSTSRGGFLITEKGRAYVEDMKR
jgi:hypothetical protein